MLVDSPDPEECARVLRRVAAGRPSSFVGGRVHCYDCDLSWCLSPEEVSAALRPRPTAA
jgi:hypothetical protein